MRVLEPDSPSTMEYRENRINIQVDKTGKIISIRCG